LFLYRGFQYSLLKQNQQNAFPIFFKIYTGKRIHEKNITNITNKTKNYKKDTKLLSKGKKIKETMQMLLFGHYALKPLWPQIDMIPIGNIEIHCT